MSHWIGLVTYEKNRNRKLNKALRVCGETAYETVVRKSPVLSGQFRGNWNIAINSVDEGTVEPLEQEIRLGAPLTALEASKLSEIRQAEFGDDVNISNSLDYAEELEAGKSWSQAPVGVLNPSLYAALSKLRSKLQGMT